MSDGMDAANCVSPCQAEPAVKTYLAELERHRELWFGVRNKGDVLLSATLLAMEPQAMRQVWQYGGVDVWNWAMGVLQAAGISLNDELRDIRNTVAVYANTLKHGDRIVVSNQTMIVNSVRERYRNIELVCDRYGCAVRLTSHLRGELQLVVPRSQSM